MANEYVVSGKRTRKYRTDTLIHLVVVQHEKLRPYKVVCTNYWVYSHQMELVDDAPNCIRCLSTPTPYVDRR